MDAAWTSRSELQYEEPAKTVTLLSLNYIGITPVENIFVTYGIICHDWMYI